MTTVFWSVRLRSWFALPATPVEVIVQVIMLFA